jgi:hypothetical protein
MDLLRISARRPLSVHWPGISASFPLSRFRGMMNTPQLAAQFLGVAIFDTARLAARLFIL